MIKTRYIRDYQNKPYAVLVGVRGSNQVGWSMVHPTDRVVKKLGRNLAIGRMVSGSIPPVPHSIKSEYERFQEWLNPEQKSLTEFNLSDFMGFNFYGDGNQ